MCMFGTGRKGLTVFDLFMIAVVVFFMSLINSASVDAPAIDKAQQVCAPNGGLKQISVEKVFTKSSHSAVCNNDVKISF